MTNRVDYTEKDGFTTVYLKLKCWFL